MKYIEVPIIKKQQSSSNANEDISIANNVISNKVQDSSITSFTDPFTLIHKFNNQEPFTKADLISLYDIYNIRKKLTDSYDRRITDATIDLILSRRSVYNDMAIIFDCDRDQIANCAEDLNKDPSRYVVLLHKLDGITNTPVYSNLRYITGDCYLQETNVEGKFPVLESIGGDGCFYHLVCSDGLESLKSIGGLAVFPHLDYANGLCSLELIGRSAYFPFLKDATGLENLKYIFALDQHNDGAVFPVLKSSKGLDNLKAIYGHAIFHSLEEATHLINLELIGGFAEFDVLKSSKGLEKLFDIKSYGKFPKLEDIIGFINLRYLDYQNSTFTSLSPQDKQKLKVKVKTWGADL